MPKKIYMIGQKGLPAASGGVERHVEELAIRLVKKGHNVFVYARKGYSGKKIAKYKGIHLIYLPTLYFKGIEAGVHSLLATIHVLFQKADIIHYHAIGPASFCFIPRILKRRSKTVFTFHCQDYRHQKWGFIARSYLKMGEAIGCKWAHKVITVSKNLRRYVKEKYGVYAQYVPNGVSEIKKIKGDKTLKRFQLKEREYFVTVTRLIKHKGVHYLIDAFNKLDTDKKLVIVGDVSYTDNYKKLLLKKAAGNKNIIFTGELKGKKLLEVFSNAYTFILPSEAEGLSIALLEAMKLGHCCIVSNIDENLEVVEDVGISFKNKNVKELSKKLEFTLKNPKEVKRLGKEAKRLVEKSYSWEAITSQIEQLYA